MQPPFTASEVLECGVQHYEWGKDSSCSAVASLLHREGEGDGKTKFAELWMGSHPSLPSRVRQADGDAILLSDYLVDHPEYTSDAHRRHPAFAETVPFLLKILSIAKALSIQAHPDKQLAEQLHALDPANYRDANHKPELVVAITPFEGLCSFRTAADVRTFVERIPPLKRLLGTTDLTTAQTKDEEKTALKAVMTALYTNTQREDMVAALKEHTDHLRAIEAQQADELALPAEDAVFLRLVRDFPSDVGCWMVYVLNLVHLNPGEGLFLRDSEPHAYLSGDGVEVMATSDNVVRAGLTPKYMDVPTLLSMLTYNTGGLDAAFQPAKPLVDGVVVQRYQPTADFPDFSLYRVGLMRPEGSDDAPVGATVTLPTFGISIVLDGSAVVNGRLVSRGDVLLLSPRVDVRLPLGSTGGCTIFIASTNDI